MSDPKTALPAVLRDLDVRPAEVAALLLLTTGAVAAVALLWWIGHEPAPRPGAEPTVSDVSEPPDAGGLDIAAGDVIVHVAGAVQQPGVFTLPGGSRVGEAIEAAGGATRRAVLDALNLARVVADGEQVLVPDRRSQASTPATHGGGTTGAAPATKLSVNQAAAADFETLPGIGPVLASRIVQHRDSVGGFKTVGELRDVPGIGEKTFQALAELVSL